MTTRMSVALKDSLLDALVRQVNSVATLKGTVLMYTGGLPTSPESPATGVLVNTAAVAMGPFTQASNGLITLAAPVLQTGFATNTAGYGRWRDSGGNIALDVDLGLTGSGAGMIVSTLSIINGVDFAVTNASVSVPQNLGTVYLNMSLRNALGNLLGQAIGNIGLGYNTGVFVYSGSIPANADLPATGTLLATFPLGTSAWNNASGGSIALASSIVVNATATGTATYARIVRGGHVLQGTIGTSGTDFTINSTALVSGNPTTLTNATIAF